LSISTACFSKFLVQAARESCRCPISTISGTTNGSHPSLNDRFDYDPADEFASDLSIQENCWHSEGTANRISVLSRRPLPFADCPDPLAAYDLSRHHPAPHQSPSSDYTITVNVDPLPITQEINKEEKEHDRIAGDYASEKKISLLTVMEKKQKKIHALMQGQTIPFHAMLAIRVWDKTRDGLNAKAGAIKNAINSMNAAQYFESNLPSTSKNLFFQTWPGWTWGRYEHRKLYAEHRFLADMLPVTSTFIGHLGTAEAIYDGPQNNLVGIETFSGSEDNKTPQHAVLLGMSGAGKSVTVCDLLTQTRVIRLHRHHRGGLSYGIYTATVEEGARPIIIHPDGRSYHQLSRYEGPAAHSRPPLCGNGAGRSNDGTFGPGRQTDAASGANRQIHQPHLRGCISGLAEETARSAPRHRTARPGLQRFRAERMPPVPRAWNLCGLPR